VLDTASATRVQALATSATVRHASGAHASSLQPSRSRTTLRVRLDTRCDPLRTAPRWHLPFAYALKTRKSWPASAAPVSKCSATTTPTPSKTCGESDHDRPMSSGAQHEQHRRTVVRTSKLNAPPRIMKMRGVGGSSLLGFQPVGRPNTRHSRRPVLRTGVRWLAGLPLAHGDCGEEARFDDR